LSIGDDLPRAFLEGHEDSGLVPLPRCVNQGLQSEHRFAGSWATYQQADAVSGQATVAQFVKSVDSGRDLRQKLQNACFGSRHGFISIQAGLSIAINAGAT
jgi:hypothetical protein